MTDEPELPLLTPLERKLGEVAATISDHPDLRAGLGDARHALHNFVLASLTECTRDIPELLWPELIERLDKLMAQVARMRLGGT